MTAAASGAGVSSSPSLAVAPKCVLLAGGGSGGHISPGLAIAERMKAIDPTCRPVFVCSQRPIDAQMLGEAGAEYVAIPAEPMSLRPRKLLRCARSFMRGRAEVLRMVDRLRPSWVVSLGGFVTAPVVHAARARGVPVLLVNLDATPGRANRWVARRAREVVSAIPTPSLPGFAREIIGMPLRRLALAPAEQASCREQLGLLPGVRTLLVTGASQGANSLNDFLLLQAQRAPGAFKDWQILHLCGPGASGGAARFEAGYRAAGVHAVVLPFLHRMGRGVRPIWRSAALGPTALARQRPTTCPRSSCRIRTTRTCTRCTTPSHWSIRGRRSWRWMRSSPKPTSGRWASRCFV
jgi:UDP-N-acetylglucosamine--N-acetylmuramyl-(pentapeptide) pyrophosphoryl-undecaprenol N-acetylglucosamine transferase